MGHRVGGGAGEVRHTRPVRPQLGLAVATQEPDAMVAPIAVHLLTAGVRAVDLGPPGPLRSRCVRVATRAVPVGDHRAPLAVEPWNRNPHDLMVTKGCHGRTATSPGGVGWRAPSRFVSHVRRSIDAFRLGAVSAPPIAFRLACMVSTPADAGRVDAARNCAVSPRWSPVIDTWPVSDAFRLTPPGPPDAFRLSSHCGQAESSWARPRDETRWVAG